MDQDGPKDGGCAGLVSGPPRFAFDAFDEPAARNWIGNWKGSWKEARPSRLPTAGDALPYCMYGNFQDSPPSSIEVNKKMMESLRRSTARITQAIAQDTKNSIRRLSDHQVR